MLTTAPASPIHFRYANRVVAALLFLSNGYFLSLSYTLIRSEGGPMGYGLVLLPFLLATHGLLFPAALAFTRKWSSTTPLFVLNLIGLLYCLCLLYFLLSVPVSA